MKTTLSVKNMVCGSKKKNYGKTYMGVQRATFLIDKQGKLQPLGQR